MSDESPQHRFEVRQETSVEPHPAVVASWLTQVLLAVGVVVFGAATNISKQIAAKPLHRYSYIMQLATAVSYVPLFGSVLSILLWKGIIPWHQMRFTWGPNIHNCRFVWLFAAAAFGDAVGDTLGAICTPYVAGPIHSLLSNLTTMFIAMLSMCALQKRYSLLQSLALGSVVSAVVLGVLPAFSSDDAKKGTDPLFAMVLGGSCIFNAGSFVIKEMLFARYLRWLEEEQILDSGGLHIFVVNTHTVLFQLPFVVLSVPLNQALGQTNGEDILSYMRESFVCLFSFSEDACGPGSSHGELAGYCVAVYVVMNISWNLLILASVKYSGALTTFVALKAVFPLSSVLFAYVHWPLLGLTRLNWLTWLSICLILPSIAAFQWASRKQGERAKQVPSEATCCWPVSESCFRGQEPLISTPDAER